MKTQQESFVQISLLNWETAINRAGKVFNSFSDEELQREVAPGRNRVFYLLGHLIASNDAMLPLLGLGTRKYQQLDEAFLKNPDKTIQALPTAGELRTWWTDTHDTLLQHFKALTPDEWLQKHTAVSDEDFVKEPHRNRLNVLHSRTNHVSYHLGQVSLAKK